MLYPKIRDIEKSNKLIKIIFITSIYISLICIFINYIISKKLNWSIIVTASIVYLWITLKHSIIFNVNIAAHTMFQTITLSIFMIIIDNVFGQINWSFIIAIPIILILSNIIIFLLTILKNKKYNIYVIYLNTNFLFSIISNLLIIFIFNKENMILNYISLSFSLVNLFINLLINKRLMFDELKRRFHV